MDTKLGVIICPKCGTENEEGTQNYVECRINLAWALENYEGPKVEIVRKLKESHTPPDS